jgi:hypothetical protein
MGGDASAEAPVRSGGFGEFGGVAAVAPMVVSGPLSESKMSMSFQTGPSDAKSSGVTSKKKRGRPGSRSSKVGDSFELGEQRVDKSLRSPNQVRAASQVLVRLLANLKSLSQQPRKHLLKNHQIRLLDHQS